mmetsp:Transcript_60359/g.174809  ORF Transcript_60359/g.174809 Transcript_60359/m.174809 type:complete len:214 (+) Transcript_60359:165-806(+)
MRLPDVLVERRHRLLRSLVLTSSPMETALLHDCGEALDGSSMPNPHGSPVGARQRVTGVFVVDLRHQGFTLPAILELGLHHRALPPTLVDLKEHHVFHLDLAVALHIKEIENRPDLLLRGLETIFLQTGGEFLISQLAISVRRLGVFEVDEHLARPAKCIGHPHPEAVDELSLRRSELFQRQAIRRVEPEQHLGVDGDPKAQSRLAEFPEANI